MILFFALPAHFTKTRLFYTTQKICKMFILSQILTLCGIFSKLVIFFYTTVAKIKLSHWIYILYGCLNFAMKPTFVFDFEICAAVYVPSLEFKKNNYILNLLFFFLLIIDWQFPSSVLFLCNKLKFWFWTLFATNQKKKIHTNQ